jgi:hypothetical protein
MKFLGLFRVLDPKYLRLIWFKPNLSLKIDIFCKVFAKKFKKFQKKKIQFVFHFLLTFLACIFANNEFTQRYARPGTGH